MPKTKAALADQGATATNWFIHTVWPGRARADTTTLSPLSLSSHLHLAHPCCFANDV